jgi:glycosyl transferase, family 25
MKVAFTVINLPHRTDRRTEMSGQLRSVGLTAEFFPALRPDEEAGFPSIGARGCFLSHLSVLKAARAAGVDRLFLMEDDLNFSAEFANYWPNVERFLDSTNWQIFYPAHTLPERKLASIAEIPHTLGIRCTHFLAFERSAINKCIAGLETILSRPPGHLEGGPMHVDGAYFTIRKLQPEMKTFASFPSLGYQRPSRTDVGEHKWFDRIPGLQPVVTAARRIKGALAS